MAVRQPAGTVTLVFTDIEGSTRLLHELGQDAYRDALGEHRRIVREAFARHDGYEVDYEGDAFFYAFGEAVEAVAAVSEAQAGLDDGPIRIRVGVHTGTPLLDPPKYVGADVHLAARVMSVGHGGQVLLSAATRDALGPSNSLLLGELGEHRLKDIESPVALFQLGDVSFPQLKTVSNTNLPRPASSFVGREVEVTAVTALVRESRLVTLTGPGGTGKTRLAIEGAAELVPEFKAGVFFVGLAALRDPRLVIETIAQTLGAKDALVAHIGERELLLVLDNFEQVVKAAPELSALLAGCPNLHLLVTSRELLRIDGEAQYAVPPLASSEAVELFCARSQLDPDETIAELCRRLDDMPLAVELAAARTAVLTLAQILERLSQRLDLLKAGRDKDPRQQTLRATIEWSYDLLDDSERQLFARLSVFAGGCTLNAAAKVADADLDTLQSLVDKSLVRHSDERFWMLETIREFAAERVEADEALGRRHAEHYLEVAELKASELGDTSRFEALDREQGNLRAACEWFHGAEQAEAEFRLVSALAEFWWVRGHYREAYARFGSALENRGPQPPHRRARTLAVACDAARMLGEVDEARRFADEALVLYRESGDDSGAATALHELGEAAMDEEQYDLARAFFIDAIEHGRSAGRDSAGSIANLGYVAMLEGDYESSLAFSAEALAHFRNRKNAGGIVVSLGNMAEAELRLGQRGEARAHLIECLRLIEETRFVEGFVAALEVVAALVLESAVEDSARLAGAGDALLEATGVRLHPEEMRRRESLREEIESRLRDADTFRNEGRLLGLDEAVSLALAAVSLD